MALRSIVGTGERLDPRDIRNDTTFRVDPGIPALEERVELAWFVPAGLQPDWFRRLAGDAVLVPADVPGDRDHELLVHALELQDARARLAEALRDTADRPAVVTRGERVGSLDHRQFGLGEPAEDGLGDDGLLGLRAHRGEEL